MQQNKPPSGYDWVITQLSPFSVFGKKLRRNLKWYTPKEKEDLEKELENISIGINAIEKSYAKISSLQVTLSAFKDPSGSLMREASSPMDEVELFEIKYFLLYLARLAKEYEALPKFFNMEFYVPTTLLSLLDPSGSGALRFSIENSYSKVIESIRKRKEKIEEKLSNCTLQEKEQLLIERNKIVKEEDEESLAIRKSLTTAVLEHKDELLANMSAIGRLDLILAKAQLARKYNCIKPQIATEQLVTATEMLHPQVQHILEQEDRSFTPVSIALKQGCTVITGANMGGKSVSLKALTLQIQLLHTGFFVFAKTFSSPLFDFLTLLIADQQSISKGLSSFGAEIITINQVIKEGRNQFYFLAVDEFARGTNPKEGAKLATALVKYLSKQNCISVLTTHYDGVAEDATAHYQVAGLQDLEETAIINSSNPLEEIASRMDYRLQLATSNETCPQDALKICKLLNLDQKVLEIFEKNIDKP